MIFKKKKERIKDILIDHVYDFCNNEIIQKMEGGGNSLTYDDPVHLKDPETKVIAEYIKKSKDLKLHYTTRNEEFCEIITKPDYLHSTLIKKLLNSGFSKGKNLHKNVVEAQDFLVARSYFAKGNPIKSKVKLTEKGIKHYLDGKSFEDNYINRRNSNIAIVISLASILIAIIAILK
ncbi:hypothetical protein [Salegentibacter mishustinae]|uniref:hypothetical protein n=1 Tax=Salegentibacter mishustinae TaxID=270918 RepID=UPI0024939B28|nr:hypothetical protein [Salegentibacter mishustinae]